MDHLRDLLQSHQQNLTGSHLPVQNPPSDADDMLLEDTFLSSTEKTPAASAAEEISSPVSEALPTQTPIAEPSLDIEALKRTVYLIKDQLDSILRQLDGTPKTAPIPLSASFTPDALVLQTGEKVLEGVFNGEKMVGPDGQEYNVPPNYASKSKLLEGDIMKLTITRTGSFIYKQIGPIPRKRILGTLELDEATKKWSVQVDGKRYKVLTASISFYHGKPGDEIAILVPEAVTSTWAAVENIIAK